MTKLVLFFAIAVGISNVSLNILASKAARLSETWPGSVFSRWFLAAFIVGSLSLVFMEALYFSARDDRFGLSNGILLMGAVSITVGTLGGYFVFKNQIHWTEWIIFGLILLFLLMRGLSIR